MKIIMEIFKKEELKVELCAPTGKAAKRLSDSCRVEARTLHRLLEVNPASTDEVRQFVKNEQNPLDADVVIVDEMSMVDILQFLKVSYNKVMFSVEVSPIFTFSISKSLCFKKLGFIAIKSRIVKN